MDDIESGSFEELSAMLHDKKLDAYTRGRAASLLGDMYGYSHRDKTKEVINKVLQDPSEDEDVIEECEDALKWISFVYCAIRFDSLDLETAKHKAEEKLTTDLFITDRAVTGSPRLESFGLAPQLKSFLSAYRSVQDCNSDIKIGEQFVADYNIDDFVKIGYEGHDHYIVRPGDETIYSFNPGEHRILFLFSKKDKNINKEAASIYHLILKRYCRIKAYIKKLP